MKEHSVHSTQIVEYLLNNLYSYQVIRSLMTVKTKTEITYCNLSCNGCHLRTINKKINSTEQENKTSNLREKRMSAE